MSSTTSSSRIIISIALGILLSVANGAVSLAGGMATIKVYGAQWGVSTRYIGAVEGNVDFDMTDLLDLGINTYRIYGGMSRWEAEDDDDVYGWPSIPQIKANPNVINWVWWDQVMTKPPYGSDYWWSGSPGTVWQGSAQTIFAELKQFGIRPILTIRNVDNVGNPRWAQRLNPPAAETDWNEWWEHVFATVYWLNVRNDYLVDDFEIHNEPDNPEQGWRGTQTDYFKLAKVARDAIDYVYKKYLPGRTYHVHAPVTVGDSHWPFDALQQIPRYFNSINIHNYATDISVYAQRVHGWMNHTAHANSPLWLGEWGTYQQGYDSVPFAVNLIKNTIRGSQSGNNYIYGSHIFSLYDWGNPEKYRGLVGAKGRRRVSYYAFRMAVRGLQGGHPTFLTSTSNANLMAIATKDSSSNLYLLVANSGQESYTINADLSALMTDSNGTMWEFSSRVMDKIISNSALINGHIFFPVPANAAILIKFFG